MKLISVVLFAFIFSENTFSQSIEDLNKKELKDLYLKTQLKVDSLSLVIKNQSGNIDYLQNQKNELSSKITQLEIKLSEQVKVISNLNEINNELNLNEKITKIKIDLLNDSIKKLNATRDLSNGKFSREEIDFISNSLSKEIKSFSENQNENVRVSTKEELVTILLGKGEIGYIPSIEFKTSYLPEFAGDFDKDGKSEILFIADVSGGGTDQWEQIYCLHILPNKQFKLNIIEIECPCLTGYSCGGSPHFEFTKIEQDIFHIQHPCFAEFDADCCPSSESTGDYIFKENKLILRH